MIYNAPEVKVLATLANVAATSVEEEEPAILDAANFCL